MLLGQLVIQVEQIKFDPYCTTHKKWNINEVKLKFEKQVIQFLSEKQKKKLYGCSQEIIKQDKNLKLREKKIQFDCIKRENIIAF